MHPSLTLCFLASAYQELGSGGRVRVRALGGALGRHWLVAAVTFLLVYVAAMAGAFLPRSEYAATATLSVEPAASATPRDSGSSGLVNVQVVSFLVPTLQAQVEAPGFRARAERNLPDAVRTADHVVSATGDPGTGLLKVAVTSSQPTAAAQLANAYATRLAQLRPVGGALVVRPVIDAVPPHGPSSPPRAATLFAGLLLGAVLAGAAAAVAQFLPSRPPVGPQTA